MAQDSFQPVNWGEEEITPGKLNAMTTNDDWLYQNIPTLKYSGYGALNKDQGVRVGGGVVMVPRSRETVQHIRVPFDNLFTTNCKPIIVCGFVSHQNARMFVSTYGFRGMGYVPLQDGFMARVAVSETNAKANYFLKASYLHWVAVGW